MSIVFVQVQSLFASGKAVRSVDPLFVEIFITICVSGPVLWGMLLDIIVEYERVIGAEEGEAQ